MDCKEIITKFVEREKRPRVGLALAGGSAYGLAHIGVLQVIEELGIPIDLVVGTSAGSMVGAIWADGMSANRMYRIARKTQWWFLAKPRPFSSGLLSSEGIEDWLGRFLKQKTFGELKVPFAATATDFVSGELVVLKSGDVAKAVRCSCSIPGIYGAVKIDDRYLVDGGLVQNLPAQVALALGAELLIGVDLHADITSDDIPKTIFESLTQATHILQRQHVVHQSDLLDVCIEPDVGGHSPANFRAVDEFVTLGRAAAEKAIPDICTLLS